MDDRCQTKTQLFYTIHRTKKYIRFADLTYDPEVYIFGPGADIIADGEEKLDLSLTYNTVTAGGTNLSFTVFGNDVLEDGAYIVRPFDAGAFAFATPQKRQHSGISLTAEF